MLHVISRDARDLHEDASDWNAAYEAAVVVSCESGDASACASLALAYDTNDASAPAWDRPLKVRPDAALHATYAARACELGLIDFCSAEVRAKRCQEGDDSACDRRGSLRDDTLCRQGVSSACPIDVSDETLPALEAACSLGASNQCFDLLDEGAPFFKVSPSEHVAIEEMACGAGHLPACVTRAKEREAADAGPVSETIALYERACPSVRTTWTRTSPPDGAACAAAANAYRHGAGVAADAVRAAELYRIGCYLWPDGGNAAACAALADMYEAGEGVTQDTAHATELYAIACRLDGKVGCPELARRMELGIGMKADPERAAKTRTQTGHGSGVFWPRGELE
jgi:TPR repeat protein